MDSGQVFAEIYKADRWGGGSGPGSRPGFCRPLVEWLRQYTAREQIGTVVDLGCGDLQWMPDVLAGTAIRYTGLDVVGHLLERHRGRMPAGQFTFELVDVAEAPISWIPRADLYWAKDVLQHWPTEKISAWLARFFAARPEARLVVCNCAGQRGPERQLDARWRFAPLSADQQPLAAWRPDVLFEWGGKQVCRLRP